MHTTGRISHCTKAELTLLPWITPATLGRTSGNHEGAFNHLQLKGRWRILLGVICVLTGRVRGSVCLADAQAFGSCQAGGHQIEELAGAGAARFEEKALVRCDDGPVVKTELGSE